MTTIEAERPAAEVPSRAATPLPRFSTPSLPTLRVAAANPRMLRVRPQASLFMARYMERFPLRRFGDNLILHSHLPENLYVADASLLPRSLGKPPILTIMALAQRVAKLCCERFG